MSWNVVLKQTCSTDVCVCTCVADVHPQQQTYRFVKTICAKPVSSSETSVRFVIPPWTEVEWIRLMLFTIRAQYNSSTDSNKSSFIPKHLLVHGKNTRKKNEIEYECNLCTEMSVIWPFSSWETIILNWRGLKEQCWHFCMFCTVTLCAVTFWIVHYIPRIY